ncbi:MAG: hypothetical protein HPY45_11990 [Anaerolineae bacterium]|nr:hypothetical protein [Anaerolineae bacterium]
MDSNTLLPLLSAFYTETTTAKTPAQRRIAAQEFSLLLRGMMLSAMTSQNPLLNSWDSSESFSTPASQSQPAMGGELMSLLGLASSEQSSLPGLSFLQQMGQLAPTSSNTRRSLYGLEDTSSIPNASAISNTPLSDLFERIAAQQMRFQSSIIRPPFTIPHRQTDSSQAQPAKGLHINQFAVEKQVGGDGANANCGPASLVMALRALGLQLPGETANSTDGELVDLARRIMVLDSDRDGITEAGYRSEKEHSTYTYFPELLQGARLAGASTEWLSPTALDIQRAVANGAKVIVSGTFEDKTPLPWTGDSDVDSAIAPGGATEHYVVITEYDPNRKLFTVHDPGRHAPHKVTAATLEDFMRGNAGALAISRA